MELPPHDLTRALREGRPQIGLWSRLTSPIAVEILARQSEALAAKFTRRQG